MISPASSGATGASRAQGRPSDVRGAPRDDRDVRAERLELAVEHAVERGVAWSPASARESATSRASGSTSTRCADAAGSSVRRWQRSADRRTAPARACTRRSQLRHADAGDGERHANRRRAPSRLGRGRPASRTPRAGGSVRRRRSRASSSVVAMRDQEPWSAARHGSTASTLGRRGTASHTGSPACRVVGERVRRAPDRRRAADDPDGDARPERRRADPAAPVRARPSIVEGDARQAIARSCAERRPRARRGEAIARASADAAGSRPCSCVPVTRTASRGQLQRSDSAPNSPPAASSRSRVAESAEPEVVREAQPRRQRHARRIGIDLPRMHRQHGRQRLRGSGLDRPQHAARRAHPQAPAPADRHHLAEPIGDERRHFEDRLPPRCAGRAAGADSRRRRPACSGAMLASRRMPSRASSSSAHSDRSLIDHSGARKPATRSTPAATQRRDAAPQVGDESRRAPRS